MFYYWGIFLFAKNKGKLKYSNLCIMLNLWLCIQFKFETSNQILVWNIQNKKKDNEKMTNWTNYIGRHTLPARQPCTSSAMHNVLFIFFSFLYFFIPSIGRCVIVISGVLLSTLIPCTLTWGPHGIKKTSLTIRCGRVADLWDCSASVSYHRT